MASENDLQQASINLDLALTPIDPLEAENYPELFAHWRELHDTLEAGREPENFVEWDRQVKQLLRPSEIARFEKPLRPHIPLDNDTIAHARHFHLTKILWARQGVERLMSDTGF